MCALLEVARLPGVRRVEAAWGLSLAGNMVSTVALLVYSYAEGGAVLVAVYSVLRAVVGAITALLVSSLSDRYRLDRMLQATTAAGALLLGLATAAAAAGLPPGLVLALAVPSAALGGTFRPLQAATFPWLVRTPRELTSANVAATIMESAGTLGGPAIAGALLLVTGTPPTMAAATAFLAAAFLSVRGLSVTDHAQAPVISDPAPAAGRMAGARVLWQMAAPGGIVALGSAQGFARGALNVLLVVLALEVLGLGDDSVGWLNAAMGFGGLLGAAVGSRVVRVNRLGRTFVGGLLGWGVGLLVMAMAPSPLTAALGMAIIGLVNAVEDASAFTLMPRLAGPRLAGRALGIFEMLIFGAVGVGSLVAPGLVSLIGAGGALAALGGALALLTLAYAVRFVVIDRTTPPPSGDLPLLRGVGIFEPLPLVVVEQLAALAEEHHYEEGDVVMREGERGDMFHIVSSGSATVSVRGSARPELGPGDGFGEIALVRDMPRTATVTARGGLTTLAISRAPFLATIGGNVASLDSAQALTASRLAQDEPD